MAASFIQVCGFPRPTHIPVPADEIDAWWDDYDQLHPNRPNYWPAHELAAFGTRPLLCGSILAVNQPWCEVFLYVEVFQDELMCRPCRRAALNAGRLDLVDHLEPVDLDTVIGRCDAAR